MAFPYSALGAFSEPLKPFADLGGFVPEPGDAPDRFDYPWGWEFSPEAWQAFVAQAATATAEAQAAVAAWQGRSDLPPHPRRGETLKPLGDGANIRQAWAAAQSNGAPAATADRLDSDPVRAVGAPVWQPQDHGAAAARR